MRLNNCLLMVIFPTWTEPWGSQEAQSCQRSLDSLWWRCRQMNWGSHPRPWSWISSSYLEWHPGYFWPMKHTHIQSIMNTITAGYRTFNVFFLSGTKYRGHSVTRLWVYCHPAALWCVNLTRKCFDLKGIISICSIYPQCNLTKCEYCQHYQKVQKPYSALITDN